ncbi:MAG: type II secretion system protein [Patescibacteria group bacterium]|nr:type II secretion system protein [Patescibacteria group bacterium]
MKSLTQTTRRGFTLIELLVVIAIIGILSAVVLASLNTARSKGNDAAVKSNMDTIRVQAELFYDSQSPTSYGTQAWTNACTTATVGGMFGDPTINKAIGSIDSANGSGAVACAANGTSWIVISGITSNYWCADSTGRSQAETTAPGASAGTYLAGGAYGCI